MSNIRFKTCVNWMVGVLKEQPSSSEDPSRLFELLSKNDLTINYDHPDITNCLTSPSLYWSVYQSLIDPHLSDTEDTGTSSSFSSFWPLIQTLARRGIYVTKDDEVSVNHSILASDNPFDKAAHCALMEGIMKCYTLLNTPANVIIKEIRRLFGLSSSKELPSTTEEALLLWVNKASRAAFSRHQRTCQEIVQEENPAKKREARLRLAREGGGMVEYCRKAPSIRDLSDGQCLAATLVYYRLGQINWKDFHFSRQLLTSEYSFSNLKAILNHCNHYLPCPNLYIEPQDWLSEPHELQTHVVTYLSLLFDGLTRIHRDEDLRKSNSFLSGLSKEAITSGPLRIRRASDTSFNSSLHNSVLSSRAFYSNPASLSNPASNQNSTVVIHASTLLPRSHSDTPDQFHHDNSQTHSLSMSNISTSTSITGSHNITRPIITRSHNITRPVVTARPRTQKVLFPAVVKNSSSQSTLVTANQRHLISASVETLGIREEIGRIQRHRKRADTNCTGDVPQLLYYDDTIDSGHLETESQEARNETDETKEWNRNEVVWIESETEMIEDKAERTENKAEKKITDIGAEAVRNENEAEKTTDNRNEAVENESECLDSNGNKESETGSLIRVHGSEDSGMEIGMKAVSSDNSKNGNEDRTSDNDCRKSSSDKMAARSSSEDCLCVNVFVELSSSFERKPFFETNEDTILLRMKVRQKMNRIKEKNEEKKQLQERLIEQIRMGVIHEMKRQNEPDPLSEQKNHTTDELHEPRYRSKAVCTRPRCSPIQNTSRPGSSTYNNSRPNSSRYNNSRPTNSNNSRPSSSRPSSSRGNSKSNSLRPNSSRPNSSRPSSSRPSSSKIWSAQQQKGGRRDEVRNERIKEELKRKLQRKEEIRRKLEERDRERKRVVNEKKKRTLPEIIDEEEDKTDPPFVNSRPTHSAVNRTVLLVDNSFKRKVTAAGQRIKSNKKLIRNALCYVCLAGEANITIKQRTLAALDISTNNHFYILFRDTLGLKFKGLYVLIQDEPKITKIFGTGPKSINEAMMKQCYKYNTGTKSFQALVAYSFSLSTDALTIQDHYWTSSHKRI